MMGGGGTRGCEAVDYPREASACEGQDILHHCTNRLVGTTGQTTL